MKNDELINDLLRMSEMNSMSFWKRDVCKRAADALSIPAVDAVPVVHGEWVHCDDGECLAWRCSVCRKYVYGAYTEIYSGEYHFCPYCGARMEGDNDV